jgi:hypothetical protein
MFISSASPKGATRRIGPLLSRLIPTAVAVVGQVVMASSVDRYGGIVLPTFAADQRWPRDWLALT